MERRTLFGSLLGVLSATCGSGIRTNSNKKDKPVTTLTPTVSRSTSVNNDVWQTNVSRAEKAARGGVELEFFTLGTPPWKTFDPFLFCVYHYDEYPPGDANLGPAASLAGRNIGQDFAGKDGWRMYHGDKVPGFPRHPHRGFETVTVSRRGLVDHFDSLGGTSRYGNGDVQWMTAGRGIAHAEMMPLLDQERGNDAEFFQIWLNLPRKDKLAAPHVTMFWEPVVPKHEFADSEGRQVFVTQIAGKLGETVAPAPPPNSWASDPNSELAIWTLRITPGAEWKLPAVLPGTERTLYFFAGKHVNLAGNETQVGQGVRIVGHSEVAIKGGKDEAEILLLQGRPIGEHVVQHGPFVMNSGEEIQQAYADFRRTQFGGWPFGSTAPVHGREVERFARHPDGRVESPRRS